MRRDRRLRSPPRCWPRRVRAWAPLTPEEIGGIVARSPLAAKYNEPIDPQSAYEILGGKVAAAATAEHAERVSSPAARRTYAPASAPAAGNRELDEALGRGEPAAAGVPYPEPQVAKPDQPGVFEQMMKSTVTRAVARSVAVAIAGTVTRSLLGVLGGGGRRRR